MMNFLAGVKDFFAANWWIVLIVIGAIGTFFGALGKWMKDNEYAWDNKAGDFFIWAGGLFDTIWSALTAIFKPLKGNKGLVSIDLRRPILGLILLCIMAMLVAAQGCTQKTLTQQIMDQTEDISTIALATYGDALQLYVSAQEMYLPYQRILQAEHPEIDARILENFSRAWGVLKRWKLLKTIPEGDVIAFRGWLREISLEIARQID